MNTDMKVELVFLNDPICGYDVVRHQEEIDKINLRIKETVHGKIIDFPCVPTKEMQIDLSQFSEIYNFDDEEMSWIDACNYAYSIPYIRITPTHLEVWLDNINNQKI